MSRASQPASGAPEKSTPQAGAGPFAARENLVDVSHTRPRRVLHRVVRAMHDGECPACHALWTSDQMPVPNPDPAETGFDLECPGCRFRISAGEVRGAFAGFAPVMSRNLEVFEDWRRSL